MIGFDNYSDEAISAEEGADKHRARVSQYLGANDTRGMENQAMEFADNCIDETIETVAVLKRSLSPEQQAKIFPLRIDFIVTPDETIIVRDRGRGLPCGLNAKKGIPTPYLIYEHDSAGGKGRNTGGYSEKTAGLHGAGAAVSVSCTSECRILTKSASSKGIFEIIYKNGKRVKDLTRVGDLIPHRAGLEDINIPDSGTEVTYKPDLTIFTKTFNGQPLQDILIEHRIRERLVTTLIAEIPEVEIYFKYKENEEIIINSSTKTPQAVLETDEVFVINFNTPSDSSCPNVFSCKLFLGLSNKNLTGRKNFNIINRLSISASSTDKEVVDTILSQIKILLENDVELKFDNVDLNYWKSKFNYLSVLKLTTPAYSAQTKTDMIETNFLPDFSVELLKSLPISSAFIKKLYAIGRADYLSNKESQELLKKERERRQKQIEAEKKRIALEKELSRPLTVAERLRDELETEKTIKVMASKKLSKECSAVVFEGFSAGSQFPSIVEKHPDLEAYAIILRGKIDNLVNKKSKHKGEKSLIPLIKQLKRGFKDIKILTDADSDGKHIRVLLVYIICKYFPDYINNGKVYIIEAPYAKVYFNEDKSLFISDIGKEQKYIKGPNYVSSKTELNETLKAGATLTTVYRGLADTDIGLYELLTNDKYLVRVKPPTAAELEVIEDTLSEDSVIKKSAVSKYFTDVQYYSKFFNSQKDDVKIKFDIDTLMFEDVPEIFMHQYTNNVQVYRK